MCRYTRSIVITIKRPHDTYGDSFNSTLTIVDSGRANNGLGRGYSWYNRSSYKVGANAKNIEWAKDKGGMTLPDGNYYLSTENLDLNSEGSYDSRSFHNVAQLQTKDPNIPKGTRGEINSGMYLIHGTEYKNGDTWTTPFSAGCISTQGNQPGHDKFMASIPAVGDLSVIRVRIQSAVNISKYLNR